MTPFDPKFDPDAILTQKRGRGRPSLKDVALRNEAKIVKRQKEEASKFTPAQRLEIIKERFEIMHDLTDGVLGGTVMSFVASGAPGTGKSYSIEGKLTAAAENSHKKIKFTSIRGAQITGIQLYKLLHDHANPGDIVLLDDSDAIYDDELCLNLVKAGLESHKVRKLRYLSETPLLDGYDKEVNYKGSMVFITNKDLQAIADSESKMSPHFKAILSRTHYLDLKLHLAEDLKMWVMYMSEKYHIARQHGANAIQEKLALEWFSKHAHAMREVSIRTVEKIVAYMMTDKYFGTRDSTWEKMARAILLR